MNVVTSFSSVIIFLALAYGVPIISGQANKVIRGTPYVSDKLNYYTITVYATPKPCGETAPIAFGQTDATSATYLMPVPSATCKPFSKEVKNKYHQVVPKQVSSPGKLLQYSPVILPTKTPKGILSKVSGPINLASEPI